MRLARADLYALLVRLAEPLPCGHAVDHRRVDLQDGYSWEQEQDGPSTLPIICEACEAEEEARVAALPPRSPEEVAAIRRWADTVWASAARQIFWDHYGPVRPDQPGESVTIDRQRHIAGPA